MFVAVLSLLLVARPAWGFAPPSAGLAASLTTRAQRRPGVPSHRPSRHGGGRLYAQSKDEKLVELADMWRLRETLARKSFKNLALYRLGELDDAEVAAAEAAANPEAAGKGACSILIDFVACETMWPVLHLLVYVGLRVLYHTRSLASRRSPRKDEGRGGDLYGGGAVRGAAAAVGRAGGADERAGARLRGGLGHRRPN